MTAVVRLRWTPRCSDEFLCACEGDDAHRGCAGEHENARTFARGCAGGVDVVDEQDVFACYLRFVGHGKGSAQIDASLARCELELALSFACAFEQVVRAMQRPLRLTLVQDADGAIGHALALIEGPLAAEEWNGDYGHLRWCVGQCERGVGDEGREGFGERGHVAVLHEVDEGAHLVGVDAEGAGLHECGRNGAAGLAEQGFVAAFKAERFPTAAALLHALGLQARETNFTDGNGLSVEERFFADAACVWREGGDQVVCKGLGKRLERAQGRAGGTGVEALVKRPIEDAPRLHGGRDCRSMALSISRCLG